MTRWITALIVASAMVFPVCGSPSREDLVRRAVQLGEVQVLRGMDAVNGVGLSEWLARAERWSVQSLRGAMEEWERASDVDRGLRLMVLARAGLRLGAGNLLDRLGEGEDGDRLADIIFARAWMKGGMGDGESSEREWKAFLARFPTDGRRGRAALMLARRLIGRMAFPEATVAIRQGLDATSDDLTRAELGYAMATVQFFGKEFGAASAAFFEVAGHVDYPGQAFYNAGLAAIRANDRGRFTEVLKQLEKVAGSGGWIDGLRAEQFCEGAMRGEMVRAELSSYLESGAGGAKRGDLQVLLMLLAHREGVATGTSEEVGIDREQLSREGRQLEFVLRLVRGEVSGKDLEDLMSSEWGGAGPVFFEEAGRAWFAAGDLVRAEQFHVRSIEKATDGDGRRRALLFAGMAAAASGEPDGARRAMTYWDTVGGEGDRLGLLARLQQGVLQMRVGREDAALSLFEFVERAAESVGDLRGFARSCMAEIAFMRWKRLRSTDAKERALALFDTGGNGRELRGMFYARSRHRTAEILDGTGDREGAVKIWREILSGPSEALGALQWMERAGFSLASVLEEKGDKAGACEVLDRIAELSGLLASEARDRAVALRLRGFLPLR